jgi:hypothetical protein
MGPTRPETSVNNYHTTPRNIPEERRSYLIIVICDSHDSGLKNYSLSSSFPVFPLRMQSFELCIFVSKQQHSFVNDWSRKHWSWTANLSPASLVVLVVQVRAYGRTQLSCRPNSTCTHHTLFKGKTQFVSLNIKWNSMLYLHEIKTGLLTWWKFDPR